MDQPDKKLKPVSQPQGAFQQTQDPPSWAFDRDLAVRLAEQAVRTTAEDDPPSSRNDEPNLKAFARGLLTDPIVVPDRWAQDYAQDYGLLDIKFFPRVPGDPPPSQDMRKVAAEILSVIAETSEEVSDQEF